MINEADAYKLEAYNPRAAASLAVHLVSQVLDEAYIIANAIKATDQPWKNLSSLKDLRNCYATEESSLVNLSFTVPRGNIESIYKEHVSTNEIVTSTPQKMEGSSTKLKDEGNFIGQGDGEFDMDNHQLRKSTSMLINHLFDMSDVERVMCDIVDEPCVDHNAVPEDALIGTVKKIVESYVKTAVDNALERQIDELGKNAEKYMQMSTHSSHSFLDDAPFAEMRKKSTFIHDYIDNKDNNNQSLLQSTSPNREQNKGSVNVFISNDNASTTKYEDAYLTLNRDYDQYCEEEESILPDSKSISLQEIELITVHTPDNISPKPEKKPLAAISSVSTGTRKSSIVRRCRIQGARLLSCFRGWWWRRKLLAKRKKTCVNSIRGLCPLSPYAYQRSSSLIDQRNLRPPSPSKSTLWKFNTVNEALVHSSRWKDFGYKVNLNESDEF